MNSGTFFPYYLPFRLSSYCRSITPKQKLGGSFSLSSKWILRYRHFLCTVPRCENAAGTAVDLGQRTVANCEEMEILLLVLTFDKMKTYKTTWHYLWFKYCQLLEWLYHIINFAYKYCLPCNFRLNSLRNTIKCTEKAI